MQNAINPSDTPQQKNTLTTRLIGSLGLNSFRGRLLYIAALSICFMVITSWLAEKHVSETTQQGISDAADQQEISRLLRGVSNDVWAAATSLHHLPESSISRGAILLR